MSCIIRLTILTVVTLCTLVKADESKNKVDIIKTDKLMREIIENEKKINKCKLTDDEIKNAMLYFFEKSGITLESLAKTVETGEKLVKGLNMVVGEKRNPLEVYKQLDMSSSDITRESWDYYVKTHKTAADIKKLDAMVPRSMDVLIDSGKKQLGQLFENWLFYHKILKTFDNQYPDEKALTPREKEKKWWSAALVKYNLSKEQQDAILSRITVSSTLSDADGKHMEVFFKDKIAAGIPEKQ